MPNKKLIPMGSQLTIIALFLIFFSILFSLTNSIYSNYQTDLKIRQFEEENDRYTQQNKLKMYEYLRSNLRLVLEKEKKASMNQINPGEEVIVLHTDDTGKELFQQDSGKTGSTASIPSAEAKYKDSTNIEKWWHFFMD